MQHQIVGSFSCSHRVHQCIRKCHSRSLHLSHPTQWIHIDHPIERLLREQIISGTSRRLIWINHHAGIVKSGEERGARWRKAVHAFCRRGEMYMRLVGEARSACSSESWACGSAAHSGNPPEIVHTANLSRISIHMRGMVIEEVCLCVSQCFEVAL